MCPFGTALLFPASPPQFGFRIILNSQQCISFCMVAICQINAMMWKEQ